MTGHFAPTKSPFHEMTTYFDGMKMPKKINNANKKHYSALSSVRTGLTHCHYENLRQVWPSSARLQLGPARANSTS